LILFLDECFELFDFGVHFLAAEVVVAVLAVGGLFEQVQLPIGVHADLDDFLSELLLLVFVVVNGLAVVRVGLFVQQFLLGQFARQQRALFVQVFLGVLQELALFPQLFEFHEVSFAYFGQFILVLVFGLADFVLECLAASLQQFAPIF
jgi:hypothetical protein